MAKKVVEVDERVIAVQAQMDERVYEIRMLDQDEAELEALLETRIEEIRTSFANKVEKIGSRRNQLITEIRTLFDQVPSKETKTQAKVTLLSGDVVVKKAGLKLDYDKKVLLENAEVAVQKYENRKAELKDKLNEIENRIDEMEKEEPLSVMQDVESLYRERNELLEAINDLSCEWLPYIKSKEVKDFDWSAYKEKLEIVEIDEIDQETGEVKGKVNQVVNKETGKVLEIEGLSVLPVAEQVVIK